MADGAEMTLTYCQIESNHAGDEYTYAQGYGGGGGGLILGVPPTSSFSLEVDDDDEREGGATATTTSAVVSAIGCSWGPTGSNTAYHGNDVYIYSGGTFTTADCPVGYFGDVDRSLDVWVNGGTGAGYYSYACKSTPFPTYRPTPQPTSFPTPQPTMGPTLHPTSKPTALPIPQPTAQPTPEPSLSRPPSHAPSSLPSPRPTAVPSPLPTAAPTRPPTALPTQKPSPRPSATPSLAPSPLPSAAPTLLPTALPSGAPSQQPTRLPSSHPSPPPTPLPSPRPSRSPQPSFAPSSVPTASGAPTVTLSPTPVPSSTCDAGQEIIDGVCEDCDAGFYKSGIGPEKCKKCPAGSVQPNMGEADCTFCTEGLYPNQDQTFCSTCSAGEFVVLELLNGTEIGKCEPCPANTFAPAATTGNCTACVPGSSTLGKSVGATACAPCTAGQFSVLGATVNCSFCPAGKMSETSSSKCVDCPAGQYNKDAGSPYCLSCANGVADGYGPNFWSYQGATTCDACIKGFYYDTQSDPPCVPCPVSSCCHDRLIGGDCLFARIKAFLTDDLVIRVVVVKLSTNSPVDWRGLRRLRPRPGGSADQAEPLPLPILEPRDLQVPLPGRLRG